MPEFLLRALSLSLSSASLALLATTATADVLVVAPTGAPYTTVQAAINAAVDGDTVLVKAGVYPGFTVTAKSLSIVSDPEGAARIESWIIIQNVGVGRRVCLSGFELRSTSQGTLRVSDCAGALRLEGLRTVAPTTYPSDAVALRLTNCADVAVLRCDLRGADQEALATSPGAGLVATDSRCALYDSQVTGGKGTDGFLYQSLVFRADPGAAGCQILGTSTLFASGSTLTGGAGGTGMDGYCLFGAWPGRPGANGGAGLVVESSANVWLLDTATVGGVRGEGGAGTEQCGAPPGSPGLPGVGVDGTATVLPGTRRVLACATHVREFAPFTLTLRGEPGDLVWVNGGFTSQWTLDLPFGGVRLVGAGSRRAFLGTVSGDGTLSVPVQFGEMGSGIAAQTRFLQAFFRDASGVSHHGSAQVVHVLDAAF